VADSVSVPPAPRIRAFCRLAVVHTPMTEAAALAEEGVAPPLASAVLGTWSAIECTLTPAVEFTPAAMAPIPVLARPKVAWSCSNGRRLPRSKIDPRST